MPQIDSNQAFQQALGDLPVKKQRQVCAKFIGNVLDLTTEPRFRDVLTLLEKPAPSAQELLDGFHSIHALYVQTHPRSDLSQLDYARQAEHFIAEARLVCLSPVYEEAKVHHLAQKAAMYCCMARTCAGIKHDEEAPQLSQSEQMLSKARLPEAAAMEACTATRTRLMPMEYQPQRSSGLGCLVDFSMIANEASGSIRWLGA